MTTETLLPVTVVGRYPQPWLEAAQDDQTRLAIRAMERAGIDIITDAEIACESYSNRLATALSGVDLDNPATLRGRASGTVVVPRIVGPIRPATPGRGS